MLFEERCDICGKRSPKRRLDRDHDHFIEKLTGEIVIRGRLCRRCNRSLGVWEWSDEVLARAIDYMKRILKLRKKYDA